MLVEAHLLVVGQMLLPQEQFLVSQVLAAQLLQAALQGLARQPSVLMLVALLEGHSPVVPREPVQQRLARVLQVLGAHQVLVVSQGVALQRFV